jgi:hypothetical protein
VTVMTQVPLAASPAARGASLYDTLELILDKGVVIDVLVRVTLIGIELLKVEVRIVIASVDTYLRFAREITQIELAQQQARPALAAATVAMPLPVEPLPAEPLPVEPLPAELTGAPTRAQERRQGKP